MTIESVKAELHEYIEHASQKKIMAIYTLVQDEVKPQGMIYDEATLDMLEKRYDDMVSEKEETYTLEQTIDNIKQYRKQYGV